MDYEKMYHLDKTHLGGKIDIDHLNWLFMCLSMRWLKFLRPKPRCPRQMPYLLGEGAAILLNQIPSLQTDTKQADMPKTLALPAPRRDTVVCWAATPVEGFLESASAWQTRPTTVPPVTFPRGPRVAAIASHPFQHVLTKEWIQARSQETEWY